MSNTHGDRSDNKAGQTRRVQLDLNAKSFERLNALKEMAEAASYAEVLKDALRVYEYFLNQEVAGSRFFVEPKGGERSELKLFVAA